MITLISVRTTVINCCGAVLGWQRSWPLAPGCQYPPGQQRLQCLQPLPNAHGAGPGRMAPAENPLSCPCPGRCAVPLSRVRKDPGPGTGRNRPRSRSLRARNPLPLPGAPSEVHRALHQTKALLPTPPGTLPTAELAGMPPAPSPALAPSICPVGGDARTATTALSH